MEEAKASFEIWKVLASQVLMDFVLIYSTAQLTCDANDAKSWLIATTSGQIFPDVLIKKLVRQYTPKSRQSAAAACVAASSTIEIESLLA